MTWNQSLNKKWITREASQGMSFEATLVNMCVFMAHAGNGELIGFTICEVRDVTQHFFDRIRIRTRQPDFAGARLQLYIPPVLAHRLSSADLNQVEIIHSAFMHIKFTHGILHVRSKLRVFNLDDSPVILKFLHHSLVESTWNEVVGQCSKPKDAVEQILRLDPDVVTMDIQMPERNGVQILKDLLARKHYPVIMISSLNLEEGSLVFDALTNGAFDYIQKPALAEREAFKIELQEKMLHAVQGRNAQSSLKKLSTTNTSKSRTQPHEYASNLLWCLGASTGGTLALTRVLTSLPDEIPPILIVQHIPAVFSKAFAKSLDALCPFEVAEAVDGEILKRNHVYIAPGGIQMAIIEDARGLRISLRDDAPVNRFKPSVDYMFDCVAKISGMQVVAGVLTGMGHDGAAGLLNLKNKGALTLAQDEASSTVYGMPRAAAENGAAMHVCSLDKIAEQLLILSASRKRVAI